MQKRMLQSKIAQNELRTFACFFRAPEPWNVPNGVRGCLAVRCRSLAVLASPILSGSPFEAMTRSGSDPWSGTKACMTRTDSSASSCVRSPARCGRARCHMLFVTCTSAAASASPPQSEPPAKFRRLGLLRRARLYARTRAASAPSDGPPPPSLPSVRVCCG